MNILNIVEPMNECVDEMFQEIDFRDVDFFLEFIFSFHGGLFMSVHKDFIDEIQDWFIDGIIELVIKNKPKHTFYDVETLGSVSFLLVFDWIEQELGDMLDQEAFWIFSNERCHDNFDGTINFASLEFT
jgi:hypothetical protein